MQLRSNSMESPDESPLENDGSRMSALEKKVSDQQNELICLKATLAEALRRLNALEVAQQTSRVSLIPSANTPRRLNPIGNDYPRENHRSPRPEEPKKNYIASFLPQRKAVHYRSTGSLHSDTQSSSSASPIPTPSPRSTPLPSNVKKNSYNSRYSSRSTPSLHRKWNSTGDFNHMPHSDLHSKAKEMSFNDEEKFVKMFLRGKPIILYAPSMQENFEMTKVSKTPSKKLKLDWVYGYRGKDCRSNLYYLPTGEVVYFVAAIVVLYNSEEHLQRHYAEHTADIKSLAIHPNKMVVATGQATSHINGIEKRAHIRVWNSVSLHTQSVIGMNEFESSVCCLSFGKFDGSLLLAVDDVSDHNISLWDWQKGENGYKITETKCSVDTVVSAQFHPLDSNSIVTCGKSHIAFWSIQINGNLFKQNGIFDTRDRPRYVTCVSFLQTGEVISGDSNGNLAIWGTTNTLLKYMKNVHDGSVFSICVTKQGNVISGGGRDGRLIEFTPNLMATGRVNQIESYFGGIRIVSEGKDFQILIGTTHNCILSGSLELGFQPIVLGHASEIWALDSHPKIPYFATAGYDRVLQLWDSMSRTILWSKDVEEQAQSICYFPDGLCLIVGCVNGKWMVFDVQTRQLLAQHADGTEPIQVIKFSPNGSLVAIGSRDSTIYIYQISGNGTKFTRVGRCSGHSSAIIHLDWAVNNQTLRSNSVDFELLFWNTETCRQIPQANVRDVEWATNTCTLTFDTIGIWSDYTEGLDVICCDRSHDSELLVTGDDFGKVKLYSYPTSQPKSLCHTFTGHSSYVTGVKFMKDNSRIISVGGNDTAVVQWRVT
ncbi:unnamed protein product [Phyllotreta striolata]|uniref:Echinoderm microtubule-associated protein-like 2 n=1 Tax=Phyllotreta striolata TaxID=444603 RepID=A0A9N9TS79_PHYSR|nr:unnamed protein product [Phyllotreta striolata]